MHPDAHVCPLCDQRGVVFSTVGRKLWRAYECPRCGPFTITLEAEEDLPGWEGEDPLIRKRLRRYLWNRHADELVLISNGRFDAEGYKVLDLGSVQNLYADDSSPIDKLDGSLLNLARHTRKLGQAFTDEDRWAIPTFDDAEALQLMRGLIDLGYAQGDLSSAQPWHIALTAKGLRRARDVDDGQEKHQTERASEPVSEVPSVFLSHSHKDKAFVERLARDLHSHGIDVWYDGWDLDIGHDLTVKIQEGISGSQYLAVVLSPAAAESAWVEKKWTSALKRELEKRQVVVLPILYQDCQRPLFLATKVYADFRNPEEYDDKLADLVRFLRSESRRPTRQAVAPPVEPVYPHTLRVSYQGQEQVRKGNELKIARWFGPDGAGGSGQLRVVLMEDLSDGVKYTSDLAGVMMTIEPVDAPINGRVAGGIERSRGTTTFDFEMTEEEYGKFLPHREVRKSF